ncbi:MAG: helix-turn-helix domain-containing protein [Candidatus Velthaea sp.]
MESATAQSFGMLLRRYRTRAGISQEALAEHSRLSVETISALERGTRRNPYRDTIALLATALELSSAERTMLESAAGRTAERVPVRGTFKPVSGPSGNLPLQLTSFVGRAPEVAAIGTLVGKNRLVTLTGSGGVGKTRLALEVAAGFGECMVDGTWFAELASLVDEELVPTAIASALHCKLPADGDPLEGLLTFLARKHLLLLLDNCEHVIVAIGRTVRALLSNCPNVALLATSRHVLGVAGETVFQVPPLSVPDSAGAAGLRVDAAPEFEALTLFVDRARAAESRFVLTDRNVPIVADICRRLDGIPLAIELAATRIKILSPGHLRDRLDERFRILSGGDYAALPRQQTLRALIDWSYDLLSERERKLFRRVGIFSDGFTLEAASAVCSESNCDELDVLELLASLVDKSLILVAIDGDAARYRLLESTRMYALEMLAATGERRELEDRHLAHFHAAVAAAERVLEATGSDATFAPLLLELENVRAALRHALNGGEASILGTFAVSAARLFSRLGLNAEGIRWLETSLEIPGPSDPRLQSRLLSAIANLVVNYDAAKAFEVAGRSIAIGRQAGDREVLAWALARRAMAAAELARQDDADTALAEATELFGPDPKPYQAAHLLALRLRSAHLTGNLRLAAEIGGDLRMLFHELGNASGELMATLNQAEDLHALGQTAAAIALVRDAENCAPDSREMHGILQSNLCGYLAVLGDASAARAAGTKALELLSGEGVTIRVADAIGHVALAHALGGDAARAARLLGHWDASRKASSVPRGSTERATYERLTAILTGRLDSSERKALLEAGAGLARQDAIAEALATDPV